MNRRGPLWLGGAVALLVVGTVLVRQDVPAYQPVADEAPAGEIVCTEPYDVTALTDRVFAVSGTLTAVASGPDIDDRLVVTLDVARWFRGPPVDTVTVGVPLDVVETMTTPRGGGTLVVGDEVLVAGDRWVAHNRPFGAVAWGCGWTRLSDEATAADWAAAASTPEPPSEVALQARYTPVGYVTGRPGLRGVLVRDGECLYLQDGEQRWLPVFADDGTTRWRGEDFTLEHGGIEVRLGHLMALGGDAVPPGHDSERGLAIAPDCSSDVPRWVVSEPKGPPGSLVAEVPQGSPFVRAATTALADVGLQAELQSATTYQDVYGRTSTTARYAVPGSEVTVTIETPPFSVTAQAYAPRPEDLDLRIVDNSEVAVVQPGDGTYVEAAARLRSGIVASVTSWPTRRGAAVDADVLARAAAAMSGR